jgi:hypothetical protein
MRFKARNRFFVTRSDNWDAFMLQTKPSIHSQMDIDTYFVLAPLADYIIEAGIDKEKFIKLIIFVKDFVNLPKSFELDFLKHQASLIISTEESMTVSKGTKEMATFIYERAYGYNPEDEKKALEQALEAEHSRAEEERLKAEEERIRAEEVHIRAEQELAKAETEKHQIILNLHQNGKMDAFQIAQLTGLIQEEVLNILAAGIQENGVSSNSVSSDEE